MPKVLIRNEDGYQKRGDFVDPVGNIETFKFWFRPALPAAVFAYKASAKTDGDEMQKQVIKVLRKHLTGWDIEDKSSTAESKVIAKIDEGTLSLVPFQALNFMLDAIFGYEKSELAEDVKN